MKGTGLNLFLKVNNIFFFSYFLSREKKAIGVHSINMNHLERRIYDFSLRFSLTFKQFTGANLG